MGRPMQHPQPQHLLVLEDCFSLWVEEATPALRVRLEAAEDNTARAGFLLEAAARVQPQQQATGVLLAAGEGLGPLAWPALAAV